MSGDIIMVDKKIEETKAANAQSTAPYTPPETKQPDVPPNNEQYPAGQDQRSEKLRAEEARRADTPGGDPSNLEAKAGDVGNKPPKGEGAVMNNRSHLKVLLKKGYWPEDGGPKMEKDTVVEVNLGEAKRMINAGIAERADPLPECE